MRSLVLARRIAFGLGGALAGALAATWPKFEGFEINMALINGLRATDLGTTVQAGSGAVGISWKTGGKVMPRARHMGLMV